MTVRFSNQLVADIVGIDRDGALTVLRSGGGGSTRLPPEYCRQHVELGYATTAHRAQGQSVDTAHAFVSATTQREPFYVMATRGRESNRLSVDTAQDPDPEAGHGGADDHRDLDGIDVLRRVLATSGIEKSATQTIADQWAHAHSASTQSAEYVTIARAVEHGGRSAEHDPDVQRALADRAQLIRAGGGKQTSQPRCPRALCPLRTRAIANRSRTRNLARWLVKGRLRTRTCLNELQPQLQPGNPNAGDPRRLEKTISAGQATSIRGGAAGT